MLVMTSYVDRMIQTDAMKVDDLVNQGMKVTIAIGVSLRRDLVHTDKLFQLALVTEVDMIIDMGLR
jgi:hypothetical protein